LTGLAQELILEQEEELIHEEYDSIKLPHGNNLFLLWL